VSINTNPYFNGSILKTGSPATANFQSAIKSSLCGKIWCQTFTGCCPTPKMLIANKNIVIYNYIYT
jgi:hypothetical protein